MAQCSHWSLTQIRLLLIIQLVDYVKVGYLLTFTMGHRNGDEPRTDTTNTIRKTEAENACLLRHRIRGTVSEFISGYILCN